MIREKKKVAFLGIRGLPSKGGAERVAEAIVNNLHQDFDISVYCSKSYSADYHPENIELIKLKNLKGKHLFSFSLSLLSAFHALLFEKFDFIHLHNTDSGFIVPLLRLKYKVVGTSHGYPFKREKWSVFAKNFLQFSEKLFFSFSNVTSCVSRTITDELKKRYHKDVQFIPNGIDVPYYVENSELFEKHKLREKEYICFAAGRVDPTKGCHFLLDAFSKLERDLSVVAIGDFSHKKDYSEKLFQMAKGKAKFIPFIEEKELLFGIIKNAKLFVFPSTIEAMSIMLLEVAALGVPIICSDIPENVAVLEDKTIYFKSGDSENLKDKIEYSLDNYAEVLSRAEKTKKWVLEKYNWETIAEKYKNMYNNLT